MYYLPTVPEPVPVPRPTPGMYMYTHVPCYLTVVIIILCSFSRNYCFFPNFTDDTPTLLILEDFQLPDGSTINILDKIGAQYKRLKRLLKDEDGTIIEEIENENMRRAADINHAIMTRWLRGEGEMPVTWRTLIDVLEKVKLGKLAQDMRDALQ